MLTRHPSWAYRRAREPVGFSRLLNEVSQLSLGKTHIRTWSHEEKQSTELRTERVLRAWADQDFELQGGMVSCAPCLSSPGRGLFGGRGRGWCYCIEAPGTYILRTRNRTLSWKQHQLEAAVVRREQYGVGRWCPCRQAVPGAPAAARDGMNRSSGSTCQGGKEDSRRGKSRGLSAQAREVNSGSAIWRTGKEKPGEGGMRNQRPLTCWTLPPQRSVVDKGTKFRRRSWNWSWRPADGTGRQGRPIWGGGADRVGGEKGLPHPWTRVQQVSRYF